MEEAPPEAKNCADCSIIHINSGDACDSKYDKDQRGGLLIKCVNKINRNFEQCKAQLCP